MNQETWESFCTDPREEVFCALYEQTKALVYTICWRILRDSEDAGDAFQATYCRLLALARDPKGSGDLVGKEIEWVVRRLAIREADSLRKRRGRQRWREIAMEKTPPSASDADRAPDRIAASRQLHDRVETLVSILPDRYRVPLLLHLFQDMTPAEIAETLGKPLGTISTQITRGLKKLRPMMSRAGLSETGVKLGAGALAGLSLIDPPASFAATAVYAQANALVAGGGMAATAGISLGKLAVGGAVMKTKIAVVSAVVALGLAGWYGPKLLRDHKVKPPVGRIVSEQNSANPQNPDVPTPLDAAGASTRTRAADIPATTRLADVPSAPEAPVQADTAPSTETLDRQFLATGVLFGKVYNEETGLPIPGARVWIVGGKSLGKNTEIVGATKQDGTYELADVPSGSVRVAAELPPLRSYEKQSQIPPIELKPDTRRRHSLILAVHPVISGVVRDLETREPIADTTIDIWGQYQATTDETGAYQIEGLPRNERTYEVEADAEKYVQSRVYVAFLGNVDSRCDFDLERGVEVDISVVDKKGAPVENAAIGMWVALVYHPTGHKTDAQGRTRIDGVSLKTPQSIYVKKEGYMRSATQTPLVSKDGEAPPLKFVLTALPPAKTGRFSGRVTNLAGEPVGGIKIQCEYEDNTLIRQKSAKTNKEGFYTLDLKNPKDVNWMTAGGKGYAPLTKRGMKPGTEEKPSAVNFVLEPAHWISGIVVDPDDQAIQGVIVQAYKLGFGASLYINGSHTTSNEEGRFRVEGLPAAKVRLSFGGKEVSSQWETLEVDRDVRIVLKPVGVIRGRVLDRETNAPIRDFQVKVAGDNHNSLREETGQSFSTEDGSFLLSKLVSGNSYKVMVDTQRFPPLTKDKIKASSKEEAEEIIFYVGKGESLRGVIADTTTEKPLPGVLVVYGFRKKNYNIFDWGNILSGDSYFLRDVKRVTTGSDGSFSFSEGEEKGTLFIKASNHLPVIIESGQRAQYGAPDPLRILLKKGGSVSGVYFRSGSAMANAKITLQGFGSVQTDARGRFGFGGLPKANYTLTVTNGPDALSRRFDLEKGEQKAVDLGNDLGPFTLVGQTLGADGLPMDNVTLAARPSFNWDYSLFQTKSNNKGDYRIEGLREGKYDVQVYAQIDRKFTSFNEKIEIRGHLEHDFRFLTRNKVTARLVFPEDFPKEVRSKLTWANLDAVKKDSLDGSASGYISIGGSSLVGNGDLVFDGRFKGQYSLRISYQDGEERTDIVCPQRFQIDNLDGDRDLGQIEAPSVGWLRLRLTFDPQPARAPQILRGILQPGDPDISVSNARDWKIQFGQTEQNPRPAASGGYDFVVLALGYRSEPERSPVDIRTGETANVSVTLRPEGMIMAQITSLTDNRRNIVPNRIALTGQGLERILVPTPTPVDDDEALPFFLGNYRDQAVGCLFAFHGLPNGTYTLTIEADGYETWQGARTVVPGEFDLRERTISLKPLP